MAKVKRDTVPRANKAKPTRRGSATDAPNDDPLAFSDDRERMFGLITSWIRFIDNYPGWREWNAKKIGITVDYGRTGTWNSLEAFEFEKPIDDIHTVILNYMEIESTLRALRDVEF